MTNLDDLKLVIPDWETIQICVPCQLHGILGYDKFDISEIEKKRFAARLVLLQIAEYLNINFIVLDTNTNNLSIDEYGVRKYVETWLNKNHPEILEWYFA